MKRGWIIASVCVAGGVVLLIVWAGLSIRHFDGAFHVPVTVLRDGKTLGTSDVAHITCDWQLFRSPLARTAAVPLDDFRPGEIVWSNTSFMVTLPHWWNVSGFGRTTGSGQPDGVYVRIELTDGKVVQLTCPMSDQQHSPKIEIDVGK